MNMEKYIISLAFDEKEFHAGYKAPNDVIRTCVDENFNNLIINPVKSCYYPIKAFSIVLKFFLKVVFNIKNNSFVLLQYTSFRKGIVFFIRLLRLKKITLTFLIHDLQSLSQTGEISSDEIERLNLADKLIVHTPQMKHLLQTKGVKIPIEVIGIFDYYVNNPKDSLSEEHIDISKIIFAGNLDKSAFFADLCKKTPRIISYNVYGVNTKYSKFPEFINYLGKFEPDKVDSINGSWGLIWDGTTCDTCDGIKGKYLQYIAPHKTSLYIVAHKPIIIWSKAAMADFVIKNKIGITIKNLDELDEIISHIDNQEYSEMKNNIVQLSKKLESGYFLKQVLHKIVNI